MTNSDVRAAKPDCARCGQPYFKHNIGVITTCPVIATYSPANPSPPAMDREAAIDTVSAKFWDALKGLAHDGSEPWNSVGMRRYGGTSGARDKVREIAASAVDAIALAGTGGGVPEAQEPAADAREAYDAGEKTCKSLLAMWERLGRPINAEYLAMAVVQDALRAFKRSPTAPTSPDESRSAEGEAI